MEAEEPFNMDEDSEVEKLAVISQNSQAKEAAVELKSESCHESKGGLLCSIGYLRPSVVVPLSGGGRVKLSDSVCMSYHSLRKREPSKISSIATTKLMTSVLDPGEGYGQVEMQSRETSYKQAIREEVERCMQATAFKHKDSLFGLTAGVGCYGEGRGQSSNVYSGNLGRELTVMVRQVITDKVEELLRQKGCGGKKKKTKNCFGCGAKDHFRNECPFPDGLCYKCKQRGHKLKECPMRAKKGEARESDVKELA